MLIKDPSSRMTISELLLHEWITKQHTAKEGADSAAESQRIDLAQKQYSIPASVISRLKNFSLMDSFNKEARKVKTWHYIALCTLWQVIRARYPMSDGMISCVWEHMYGPKTPEGVL